ncbi:hypothetical protein CFC21_022933, partial [Triticum aestivum]
GAIGFRRPAPRRQREPKDAPPLGVARGGRVPPLRRRRLRARRERPRPGVPRRHDPGSPHRRVPRAPPALQLLIRWRRLRPRGGVPRALRSPAALEAGIVVEPATAHRLVSVAVLLGAKFSSPRYFERRVESFQICSGESIRSTELCPLELLFLRALDYRVFIGDEEFRRFFRILERRPAPARSVACAAKKRKAEEEVEPRRVRACQLAARYGISGFNQS